MAGETRRTTLRDYVTLRRGTTYKSRLLGQPGPVLLGLATIQRNGGFRRDSLQTYGGDCPAKLMVRPGELYVSLKDVTQSAELLGAVARLPRDHAPGRLTQDTVKLEPTGADVPMAYLYWLLRTPACRSYCAAHATGTTNLGLAREDFLSFPASEPTADQLRLVELLDALDDKIELNRRMNETLEAMARALFKSWFVDFDPVRAKAEGRETGLPTSISSLFPDQLINSTLGPAPRGWEATSWGDLVTLAYGKSLAGYEASDGTVPVYGTNGRIGSWTVPLCDHPGVIIGRKGAYRGVHFSDRPFFAIDTAFFVEPRVPTVMRWIYYELLRVDINSMDSGSAIPSTSREEFYALPVVRPTFEVQRAYERVLEPAWSRQGALTSQSRTLAALRDALLPKLLSGELRVPDAERLVEAAT